MKSFVYMVFQSNHRGFTYISVLLSLCIIIATLPIIPYFLGKVNMEEDRTLISVDQFFVTVQNELNVSELVRVDTERNQIYFRLNEGDTGIIEQYETLIRRTGDVKGHEIYLRDVKEMELQLIDYGFLLRIKMMNGEIYEKKFATK